MLFFFFKQKTAYERRISDWGSDVCSSDLNTDPMRVEESRVQHRRCAAMFQIPMAAASRQVNVRPTSKVRRATFPAAHCAARPPLLSAPQPPVPPETGAWQRKEIGRAHV